MAMNTQPREPRLLTSYLPVCQHLRGATRPPTTPLIPLELWGGRERSPGGPPVADGGGAAGEAAAGPGSDGAGAARRVAGPCEEVDQLRGRGPRGSESRARTTPPAALHLPLEPPARALASLPQQHLRGEHQSSTERRTRGGGSRGARAAGTRPGRGEGPGCAAPPPLLSVVLSAFPSSAPPPSMRILEEGVRRGWRQRLELGDLALVWPGPLPC